MKVWKLDGGSTEWVVAETAEQAKAIHKAEYLCNLDEADAGAYAEPVALSDSTEITVYDFGDDPQLTLTAAGWVAKMGKPGLLCCSEY